MNIDKETEEIENQDKIENPQDYLYGIHKEQVIKDCMCSEFPGTSKWSANNPIWDCNIAGKKSPKEAWDDYSLMSKAVDNLYYIMHKSIAEHKYEDFVDRVYDAFEDAYENGNYSKLKEVVLTRFTVAKIAPKVTALMPSAFERILEESKIDISSGIYCPMAGFGGIIEGAKRYYKKHKINAEIEAYDINSNFCNYYGWKQRDVLAQKIKTDKIVFVCPPFGQNTERWKGTPEEMYYDFHTWCKLIKEQIDAPNYIFVGPEITTESKYKSGIKPSGLFRKKYGIQYYPEYSIK